MLIASIFLVISVPLKLLGDVAVHVSIGFSALPGSIRVIVIDRVGHRASIIVKVTTGTDGPSCGRPPDARHTRVRNTRLDASMEDVVKVMTHGN